MRGLSFVCRACSTARGCKSPLQPDGGEVVAKRKCAAATERLKEAWSKRTSRCTKPNQRHTVLGERANDRKAHIHQGHSTGLWWRPTRTGTTKLPSSKWARTSSGKHRPRWRRAPARRSNTNRRTPARISVSEFPVSKQVPSSSQGHQFGALFFCLVRGICG